MKRREFFNTLIPNYESLDNKILNNESGLDKYNGNWDKASASHLLKRSLIGFYDSDLNRALGQSFESCIDDLLNDDEPMPTPPVKYLDYTVIPNLPDDGLALGETFVDKPLNFGVEIIRVETVKAWWWGHIIGQGFSLRERMTLFWHNHFSTQAEVVTVGRFQYATNQLFRDNSLKNFKELVKLVSHDPTMMLFLNGNENIVGKPNENFARELLELFTIGKGLQKGEGDYTTYTEEDVISAAKILTGWNFNYRQKDLVDFSVKFYSQLHDYSSKKFSYAFDNKIIQGSGAQEFNQLIDMIFAKQETAKYIVRKLYRWFVYYKVSEFAENEIITPLAQLLISNNFEIKPVLKTLLSSKHFMDESVRGAMIKNPVDFLVNVAKETKLKIPFTIVPDTYEEFSWYFTLQSHFKTTGEVLNMALLDPPSVAGWEAYYQTPGYYRTWISSVTYPNRVKVTDTLLSNRGIDKPIKLKAFALDLVSNFSDPSDVNLIIQETIDRVLPFDLNTEQKSYLKEFLLNKDQGDYVWADTWLNYKNNPNDNVLKNSIESKLATFLRTVYSLAEYQLM